MNNKAHILLFLSALACCTGLMHTQCLAAGDSTQAKPGEKPAASPRPVESYDSVRELQADLENLLSDERFSSASIGAGVYSPTRGAWLFEHRRNKAMLPASCVKLFTTAAALEQLGPDFVYSTSLYLDGVIKSNGEFVGNVIIRGAGDPTMSAAFGDVPEAILDEWVDQFELHGISSIRGNLVGDDSYFDHMALGPGWAWDDAGYAYSAEVSALSFFDNKVIVVVEPGDSVDAPVHVEMRPRNEYVDLRVHALTGAADSSSSIQVQRDANANVVHIHGRLPYDSVAHRSFETHEIAVINPTRYTLHLFVRALEERGIRFRGRSFDSESWGDFIDYTDIRPVYQHSSPALGSIVGVINRHSHNLAAEMLFKTLAKESTGVGSFEAGAEVLRSFGARHEVAPESVFIVDGSGLSRLNSVAPQHIISVLSDMYNSPHRDVFVASLATPGTDGTMENRMKGSSAETRVFAKTGTMNNTSALAGYVYSGDGEALAFAVIVNHATAPTSLARNLQDLFAMRLAAFRRSPSAEQSAPDGPVQHKSMN